MPVSNGFGSRNFGIIAHSITVGSIPLARSAARASSNRLIDHPHFAFELAPSIARRAVGHPHELAVVSRRLVAAIVLRIGPPRRRFISRDGGTDSTTQAIVGASKAAAVFSPPPNWFMIGPRTSQSNTTTRQFTQIIVRF